MGRFNMSVLLTIVVFMVGMSITNMAEAQETATCAQKLVPCANYINSTSPPSSCCDPIKEAVQTQLQCLCNLYSTPGVLKSFGITVEQALRLSKACGVSTDLSKCNNGTAPSGQPAAVPGADTPSGAGRISWTGISLLLLLGASMMFY